MNDDHTNLKEELIQCHNELRTDPKGFIKHLEDHLKLFKGMVFNYPGEIGIRTNEGPAAVKEAIAFLSKQPAIGSIELDDSLCKAAQDHADDTGPKGITGHDGTDGSSMSDRIERYCEWEGGLAENIDYGKKPALRVIMALLIDDGVKSRGHRKNLFNDEVRYAGFGIGPHKVYGMMVVIDYAFGISGKKATIPKKNNKVNEIAQKMEKVNLNGPTKNNVSPTKNVSKPAANQKKYNMSDDPDCPEGAVGASIKVSEKTCNGKTTKVTIKTYTLDDGSKQTVELTETY